MKRVLVVGDIIADVYRDCHYKKMCPDAPTVRAIVEGSVDLRPGGAANVALNLAELAPDVQVDLIGVLTSDVAAHLKFRSRNRINMDFCELVGHHGGHLQKERISLDGELLLRVDSRTRINQFLREQVGRMLREYLATHDPVMIVASDYDGGALYGPEDDTNLQIILSQRERLLVDTKITDLSVFDGTMGVKLNRDEWAAVLQREAAPERFFGFMVVTDGPGGARCLWHRQLGPGKSETHTFSVLGRAVEAVDVCGCGDTFLAGLAASLLMNGDPFTATQFANAAASTVVTKQRTEVADREATLRLVGREE